jgi:acyl-ACP thioesterase
MELFYKTKYKLRPSDFRPNDTLSIPTVLDILQDLAGDHATQLGLGFDDFIKKDLIWMIVSTKFEIVKDIPMYSTIDACTWPRKKGKIDFFRDYRIDYNNEVCVKATSRWIIANYKTRHIYIPRDIDFYGEYHEEENNLEIEKLEDFDVTNLEAHTFIPKFMDLDHNGHVNNIKYAIYIENVLELDKQIKSFSITYVKEAKLGEIINIFVKKKEYGYDIKGIVNNETCFLAKVEV